MLLNGSATRAPELLFRVYNKLKKLNKKWKKTIQLKTQLMELKEISQKKKYKQLINI